MSELVVPVLGSEASSFRFWLCSSGPAPGLGGDGAGSASADGATTSTESTTNRSTTKRETLVMSPLFAGCGSSFYHMPRTGAAYSPVTPRPPPWPRTTRWDAPRAEPVAARDVAGGADEVRAVHRGSLLPDRVHALSRRRASCHHSRRDRRRPLRRA